MVEACPRSHPRTTRACFAARVAGDRPAPGGAASHGFPAPQHRRRPLRRGPSRPGTISRQAVYDVLAVLTDKGLLRRIQPGARRPGTRTGWATTTTI